MRPARRSAPCVALHNFGAGDLIEVRRADGGDTVMLPFTQSVVPQIDIAGGRIVVARARRGLFECHRRRTKRDAEPCGAPASSPSSPTCSRGRSASSLAGKAREKGIWALDAVDLRDYATDKHRTVDDTPAGGGPGMVMKPDVIARAIDAVATDDRPRLLMSPRGAPLTQARVATLAQGPGVVLLCGRFEGVDERVIAGRSLEEVSVGDYVLSGGEIAAMVLIDACVRLLPGVMGAGGLARRGELRRRPARIPAIHPAAGLGGAGDPGGAGVGRSRQGRGLAAGRGRAAHRGAPARPVGRRIRRRKPGK